jgi:diguanylate cyclase (GGDEF)-like protein
MNHDGTKDTKIICVLLGDVSNDFIWELMRGMYNGAMRRQVHLIFLLGVQKHAAPMDAGLNQQEAVHYNSIYDYTSLVGADSLIVACGSLSGFTGKDGRKLFMDRFADIPYVLLQESFENGQKDKSYIAVDNYYSFIQCVEHLIQVHGYRKIAYLSGPEGHPEARERMRAYRDTMKKYGLPVTEKMIAFGDFSEFADAHVATLIDNNPGLEAIVFANDEMAKAGYRECRKRCISIGSDLAITGFDDFSVARSLEPPLTSVSQDAYKMGELAVMQAASLAEGRRVTPVELKTQFHVRGSCSCAPGAGYPQAEPQALGEEGCLDAIIADIMKDVPNRYKDNEVTRYGTLLGKCLRHFYRIASNCKQKEVDKAALYNWMHEELKLQDISIFTLARHLGDFLQQLYRFEKNEQTIKNIAVIVALAQQYLYSNDLHGLNERFEDFRMQSWFVPEFIRDLVDRDDEDESVFLSVVERLRILKMNSVFLFLLEEPQVYRRNLNMWTPPQKMCLAACHSGNETKAYPRSQMPVVTKDQILSILPVFANSEHMMALSIFSGEVHYGILMCDADIGMMPFLHVIGLQLGMLMNFLDLKRKEKIISDELEDMREKNEILNFLSEYDQLCGLLNRRGFIQRAIRRNRENVGKTAYCVFMDLDHLKEINDTFGHSAGDDALHDVSIILKSITDDMDLIARIGGDEFVGMFITDSPDFGCSFKAKFKAACEEYNSRSGKLYFVEASVGVTKFTCTQGLEISTIIGEADKYLYKAKQLRRKTIRK